MRKIIQRLVLCTLLTFTALQVRAGDLYLRGENYGNWQAEQKYKLTPRADGTYLLHLDRLDGQFKIGDAEWTYDNDFGAPQTTKAHLLTSAVFTAMHRGANIVAHNLLNVDIIVDPATSTLSILAEGCPVSYPGTSGTLPVLFVDVYTDETYTRLDNEIADYYLAHKDYFKYATYRFAGDDEAQPLQIKARGNWTRKGFSKKPFKIKLDKKAALCGLTSSKHFALLAHADDTWGWMRNFAGFALGRRIGLPWTPAQVPIELVLNGDVRGVYFLTESIRVDKKRVNIAELDDLCDDPALASGGYIVELDNYDEDNQLRLNEKAAVGGHYLDVLRVTYDTPEELSQLQERFLADQFTAINDAIGGARPQTWSYLDLDDAVRYYIVTEMLSHVEAYHGSTYLMRDRGENQKWHFSPLWDMGNAFNGPTDDFFYNHDPFGNTWIPSLAADLRFDSCLRATWLWFVQNGLAGFEDDLRTYADMLKSVAQADYLRWHNEPMPVGGQPVADNRDMDNRLNSVLTHLRAKQSWLCTQWGVPDAAKMYAEPQRDSTPAAPLPSYLSGIKEISIDMKKNTAPQHYYDMLGRPVSNPVPGMLYITPKR